MPNSILSWTGAIFWMIVFISIATRLIQTLIFASRIGWKRSRRLGIYTWLRWLDNPPDTAGDAYYPSKSGARMRKRDERELEED